MADWLSLAYESLKWFKDWSQIKAPCFFKNPAFIVLCQGRNVISKLFAFNRLWLAAEGRKVADSRKEKDLAGFVKFTVSTDSLEIEFSTEKNKTKPKTCNLRHSSGTAHQMKMQPYLNTLFSHLHLWSGSEYCNDIAKQREMGKSWTLVALNVHSEDVWSVGMWSEQLAWAMLWNIFIYKLRFYLII